MSTVITEVYQAFLDAGASEEKARAAASALSEAQLATKGDVSEIRADLAALRAELSIIKWVVSGVGFGTLMLVIRSFMG